MARVMMMKIWMRRGEKANDYDVDEAQSNHPAKSSLTHPTGRR